MSRSHRGRVINGLRGATALVSFSFTFSAIVRPLLHYDFERIPGNLNPQALCQLLPANFFMILIEDFLTVEKIATPVSHICELETQRV